MPTRSRSLLPALVLSVALAVAATTPPRAGAVGGTRPLRRVMPWVVPTRGERAAHVALSEVGVPYVWGGESPQGFDCSGLVRYAYLRVGISLPHSSYALYGTGTRVTRSQLEPGDVLFFSGLDHVGIYIGGGRMVHAPQTGMSVEVVSLSSRYGASFVAARRMVAS